MKDKVKFCVVSHTHWDREWYFSQAKHNYNFMHFMDNLIALLESDKNYSSFHLDGQVIILEDYLQIRPQMKDKICELVSRGKLKIGPFYVLQDEYLISGEANIRNLYIGLYEAEKYGKPTMVGYFPDTFGNIGQMPQILNGFGIDNAFIGRGPIITSMPYDNELRGKNESGFAESVWTGADGSEVLAVQFLWWYGNGMELPLDKGALKEKLDWLADNMLYSQKTPFILVANGCDHQPVQTDLSYVISIAKELGYNIEHISYENFIEKIRPYKKTFGRFYGEIDSQNGNGFRTLRETASSRIYLKQLSYKAEFLLSGIAEPLSVIADVNGIKYDYEILLYCWKKLLENYAHDSICGCGVDEVHKEMEVRFSSLIDTINSHIEYLGKKLVEKFAFPTESVVVVNCYPKTVTDYVTCTVDFALGDNSKFDNGLFIDCKNENVNSIDGYVSPEELSLFDNEGNEIDCNFKYLGKLQTFSLPENSFRKVFDVHRYTVDIYGIFSPLSITVFRVGKKRKSFEKSVVFNSNSVENEFIRLSFNKNGTFNILDKENGGELKNQNYFTEIGDGGNEYEFFAQGTYYDTLSDVAKVSVKDYDVNHVTFTVCNNLSQQNGEKLLITSEITVKAHKRGVFIKTFFNNTCRNHRIRAVFDFENSKTTHNSSGQFDLTTRHNAPSKKWQKEDNPFRTYEFIERISKNNNGAIIAVRGNNEYEINKNGSTEITLVRGVNILGDWFPFITYDSQCLRQVESSYMVEFFTEKDRNNTIDDAFSFHKPRLYAFSGMGNGEIVKNLTCIRKGDVFASCVKQNLRGEKIMRIFNPYNEKREVIFSDAVTSISMNEQYCFENGDSFIIPPKKIITVKF